MKVIRTTDPLTPDIGDIEVYGLKGWLKPFNRVIPADTSAVIALDFVSLNPWRALQRMGIDASELKESCTYECPITDREYAACVPSHIIMRDSRSHLLAPVPTRFREMAMDIPWMRDHTLSEFYKDTAMWYEKESLSKILACHIGPGYTEFISAWDGSNSVKVAALQLDNGDDLVCYHLEWYNK